MVSQVCLVLLVVFAVILLRSCTFFLYFNVPRRLKFPSACLPLPPPRPNRILSPRDIAKPHQPHPIKFNGSNLFRQAPPREPNTTTPVPLPPLPLPPPVHQHLYNPNITPILPPSTYPQGTTTTHTSPHPPPRLGKPIALHPAYLPTLKKPPPVP